MALQIQSSHYNYFNNIINLFTIQKINNNRLFFEQSIGYYTY